MIPVNQTNERRPGVNGTAPNGRLATSPHRTRGALTLADLDTLAESVRRTFVVVVSRPCDDNPGRVLRRPYLTAKAAERAAQKATERGQTAVVYLAELRPAHRIIGGGR